MQCWKVDLWIAYLLAIPWYVKCPELQTVESSVTLTQMTSFQWWSFDDGVARVFTVNTPKDFLFMTWWGLVLTWGQINELNLPSNPIFSWKFSSWIIEKKTLIFWMLTQVRHDKLDDKVPRHLRMTIFLNIKRRNMKCLSLFTSHISSPKIYAWLTRNWIMKNIIISSETAAFCLVQSDFLLSWVSKKTSCFILNASFADSFSNKSA